MPPIDTTKKPGARSEMVAAAPPAPAAREVRYDPAEIEARWQKLWDAQPELYRAEPEGSGKPKYYVLEMLPYPSGQLHMGHVRNYAIGDALARYMWMQGYNVLHPMGWDAFGLPAENAALKNHTPPREWTLENIAHMRRQMRRLGLSYDWQTEITTCLPDYYRWTQWFFLRMLENGLASQAEQGELVPAVRHRAGQRAGDRWLLLAARRHGGGAARPGAGFLRTTNYAQELLDGLDQLPGWPEKVRTMQRNWIGRSEGATIEFVLDQQRRSGRTAVAKSPFGRRGFCCRRCFRPGRDQDPCLHHPPRHHLRRHQLAVGAPASAGEAVCPGRRTARRRGSVLVEEQKKAREAGDPAAIDKRGVFTGHYAINPFNGERLPIWVANYILLEYGTGAVMSVPAHDERDYEFARKYGLEVRIVVLPRRTGEPPAPGQPDEPVLPYTEEDSLLMNSGEYNGLGCQEARHKMAAFAQEHGFGQATVTFRLKDWGVSRQRYWVRRSPCSIAPKTASCPYPTISSPSCFPSRSRSRSRMVLP